MSPPDNPPHNALRRRVSGAVERGEADPITEEPAGREFEVRVTVRLADGSRHTRHPYYVHAVTARAAVAMVLAERDFGPSPLETVNVRRT